MTSSKILFFICVSFVLGVFFESVTEIPQSLLWAFLVVAVFLIFIFALRHCEPKRSNLNQIRLPRRLWAPRNDELIIFGFCVLFLIMGILRVQISEFNIANDRVSKLNGKGEVSLAGFISAEPDIRDTSQRLEVKVLDSVILVTTKRYPEYKYLDKIKFTGKLEAPMVVEDFNYKDYLMKDGIYSVMAFPKIEVIGKASGDPFSAFYSGILWIKQRIRESIRSNFLPPQSLILEGTVLGDNAVMTQDLKDKLNATGLRHIIAVSGTHVVILSVIIMSLLLALGLYRGQAFYFSVIFIWLYVVLTGLSASGLRAGIMGTLFLLAEKLGRQSMNLRIITLAGALMLVFNPLILVRDVGFQLSFLAVLGLIFVDPLFKLLMKNLTQKLSFYSDKAEGLVSIISATFAAQVFTLPIMVYNFGNISLVAPVTNLLVSPIVSFLMIFGFISSFVGIFSGILGWILSVPCYFLLSYFLWIINIFSQPWAMIVTKNVSIIWILFIYLVIIFLVWLLNKKYSKNFV